MTIEAVLLKERLHIFREVHLPRDLLHHGDAPTVTRLLIERGFGEDDIAKVLRENWLRVLRSIELR